MLLDRLQSSNKVLYPTNDRNIKSGSELLDERPTDKLNRLLLDNVEKTPFYVNILRNEVETQNIMELASIHGISSDPWLNFKKAEVSPLWCCLVRMLQIRPSLHSLMQLSNQHQSEYVQILIVLYARYAVKETQFSKAIDIFKHHNIKMKVDSADFDMLSFFNSLLENRKFKDMELPPLSLVTRRSLQMRKLSEKYCSSNGSEALSS